MLVGVLLVCLSASFSFACLTAVCFLTILVLVLKYSRYVQSLAVVVMSHSCVKARGLVDVCLIKDSCD